MHAFDQQTTTFIVALALVLTGCPVKTPSPLVGSVDLTLVDDAGEITSVVAADAPNKYRAQVNDDGERCELELHVDFPEHERLNINTFPDQILPLFAGEAVTVPASSNSDRTIVANYATLFWQFADDSTWAAGSGGDVHIAALPEPGGLLRVELLDVSVNHHSQRQPAIDRRGTLSGQVELTFLGAMVTGDAGRACPSVAAFPGYDAL